MYNIEMYNYNPKPFSFSRKYGIHPLAEEPRGLEKFLGPDSHNHNYLSRLNPKVFREIVGMDYESIIAQQEREIADKKKEAYDQKDNDEPVKGSKVKFSQEEISPDQQGKMHQDDYCHEHQTKCEEESKGQKEDDLPNIAHYKSTNLLKDPMRQTTRHYHRKYNFKDIYGYEKPMKINTHLGRTLTEMNQLKRNKLGNNEFQSSHSKDFCLKKRYDGFTSYCVPRTDEYKAQTDRTGTPFDIYSRNINKVMASTNQERNCQTEYETLQQENEKMKEIIKNHTNANWMQSKNLPSVGTILEKNQKAIRNTSIGNSKIMGEKYNPFNNYFGSKNRTGRNFTGALFQH